MLSFEGMNWYGITFMFSSIDKIKMYCLDVPMSDSLLSIDCVVVLAS